MKINIVCAGKMKEKYFLEAQKEYVKMLGRFCDVTITEIPDEPLSNIKSSADEQGALMREGDKILPKLKGYVIAADVKSKEMTSEEFAEKINSLMNGGISEITFVVGSSLGMAKSVKQRADARISFSKMTMPHRLFRIVLEEQLFRAFKIINKETYHK